MSLNFVTVTWDETDIRQIALGGSISFAPNVALQAPSDGLSISTNQLTYYFAAGNGQSDPLVSTDSSDILQSGWTYIVTVAVNGVTPYSFNCFINFANGTPQKLSSLVPVVSPPAVLASLPLPSGVAAAGQVPVATGVGEASAWTTLEKPATLVVAASNASTAWKNNADYVCTGVNDDVKILAATAALPSQGGTVLLSDGTFTIGHALIPTVNQTRLLGQGTNATNIVAAVGANCNGYQFDVSQSVSLIFCCLEGMTFNGNYNSGSGNTSGYGAHINYNATFTFWDFYLRDVWFTNWANDGFWGTGGHGYVLDHVLAEFNGGNGINFTGGFTDTPPRIVNGTVKLNNGSGILVNVTDAYVGHMEVSSNSGSYGIALTSSGAKVIGNQVRSNTATGIHASGSEGHQILGNTVAGNGQHGILADSPNNTIAGNFLNNNSTTAAGAADEIRVQTGGVSAPGNTMTGNVIDCQNQSGYGINVASANAFSAVAVGNRIVNPRTGKVLSAAPDSLFLDSAGLLYGAGSAPALDLSPLLAPAGATAETFPRQNSTASLGSLVSGTAYLSAIPLPAGLLVSNIALMVGGTAFTGVTHGWYALTDATRIVRAVTADQTGGNWGTTFAPVSLPLAVAYTTPSPGVYYIAFCATFSGSGVFSAIGGAVGGITGIAPVLQGTSNTGLSTPPALSTQLNVLSGTATDRFYAYTS